MGNKLIMHCIYVQSIDEYIAAFEDGYRDIHYAGFSRDGLISTLQRRGETNLEYQYQYGKELYFAGEEEKAHKIFQELVAKGFEFAKIGLSADAAKGIGGPANPALAFRLLKELDGKDYGMAYHNLGYCYYNGIGTKEDIAKAIEYFEKALDYGVANSGIGLARSLEQLAKMKNTAVDERAVFVALLRGAQCGSIKAMEEVADRYRQGLGCAMDKLAYFAWNRAAERAKDVTKPLIGEHGFFNPGRYGGFELRYPDEN